VARDSVACGQHLCDPRGPRRYACQVLLVGEFQGAGVWRYTQNPSNGPVGWQQINTHDAAQVDTSGFGVLMARFGSSGVWENTYSSGWAGVTGANASTIDAGG